MLKKSLPFLTAVFLFNTASPSTLIAAPSFYAGLQGGYSYANTKIHNQHYIGAALPLYTLSKSIKNHEFQGGFILGGDYIGTNRKVGLGLQLIGDFDTHEFKTEFGYNAFDIPLKVKATRPFTFIPSATLIYLVKPSLRAFLSLGLGLGNFKIRLDNADDAVVLKKKITKPGFASSLGIEYQVSQRLSCLGMVGLEHYGTVKATFQDIFPQGQTELTERIKPRYITTKIGFLVRFGKRS